MEVKAVTMATGTRKVGKNRYELVNRIGYASNVNAETFGYLVATLAIKLGYLTAKHVVIISDGATWIHNIVHDWFPDAIHVLDLFHLIKHIDETFGSKCTGVDKTTLDNAIKAVYAYDADKLLDIIVSWNPNTDKLNKKDELITYITNNLKQINNHKLVGLHGSGYIEKGVDLMISRRLKLRGMSWSKIGSEAILKLQVMKYNKQTKQYFAKRKGIIP
jgi:hypothetical protein